MPRDVVEPARFPDGSRPLRIFISCAEPSGELHAVHFVRAVRDVLTSAGAPAPTFVGLGGADLAAEGVELVGDPVAQAAMGSTAVRQLGFYVRMLRDVAAELRARPVDLVVPVDSPALHVPLAHLARSYGAPVVHYVTPQYWGWAPWRVRGYRRAVDLALTIMPFEPAWFEADGVRVAHVGHPILDVLDKEPNDVAPQSSRTLALLPGSRAGVVDLNLPFMLAVAARVRLEIPELEVVLLLARPNLLDRVREHLERAGATNWVTVVADDLHPTLGTARAALSVSGTVVLDLLHHRLPAVVVYRLGSAFATFLANTFLITNHFSSINLLAGKEVVPEFAFHGEGPIEDVSRAVVRAMADDDWRQEISAGLEEAARRLGPPGAAQRAAGHALATALGAQER